MFFIIGAEPTIDPVQLQEINPSTDLLHSILAVSHADSAESLLQRNVAGFLYVYVLQEEMKLKRRKEKRKRRNVSAQTNFIIFRTEVNMERHKITVLAPCPGPLPSKYLIFGSLKWLE